MASFKKRGDKITAEVRLKGRYSAKTFTTKGEAKAWAIAEEHRLGSSSPLSIIMKGKSLGEAFQRYAQEETPKKKGARWETIRLIKLGRDEIASLSLTHLVTNDFEKWIEREDARGLRGSSIRRELQIISAVLTKARKWKWIEGDPLEGLERPQNPPPRDKYIEEDEKKRILLALDYEEDKPVLLTRQRIAVAFLIAIETAMRHSEIWNMQWEDINWKKNYVNLPQTKNGTSRDVPLSSTAVRLLKKLNPTIKGPVIGTHPTSSETIFRKAVDLAGYKHIITFHDTRHTATTNLAGKLDMLTLARVTGHKDPRNLMIYFNPKMEDIAKKIG